MVMERVLIPTKLIDHPYIVSLLELSAKEFGYHQQGLLQVPYDANCLKKMVSPTRMFSGKPKSSPAQPGSLLGQAGPRLFFQAFKPVFIIIIVIPPNEH
ncbi:hypothetical protein CISIN_1g035599mg [Citrus sinensis]|uniref:Auxin-responsive protein n=1 Tax=Citrus sinensis TaxID=2711 RepID=A0A067D2W7_CITSI|nr:hypothetical protein CISIN_1g035599mg [Citrus sinensis]